MAKPASKLNWIPDNTPSRIIEPTEGKKAIGYNPTEKPTYQGLNWLFNTVSNWLDYFEDLTDTPASETDSGHVTIGAQSFSGKKTFLDGLGPTVVDSFQSTGAAVFNSTFQVNGATTLNGNLSVVGTLTYLNVDNLQVEDQSIELNFGGSDVTAEGSGLTIVGTSNVAKASLKYDSTMVSKWKIGDAVTQREVIVKGLGQISNNDIDAAAGIPYSKLNLTASVTNADIVSVDVSTKATGILPPANGGVPPGVVNAYIAATAPTGWLLCNGAAVSRTTYAALFAIIGTAFNTQTNPVTGVVYTAPAGTDFRLPDLRTVFIRGVGGPNVAGITTTLGGYQADTTAKNSLANAPSSISGTAAAQTFNPVPHQHTGTTGGATLQASPSAAQSNPGGGLGATESGTHSHAFETTFNNATGTNSASSVSGTAAAQVITGDAETRPDNIGMHYIIKT